MHDFSYPWNISLRRETCFGNAVCFVARDTFLRIYFASHLHKSKSIMNISIVLVRKNTLMKFTCFSDLILRANFFL